MADHFPTELAGADDHAKLHSLCGLTYKEQGVWFLNAFWEAGLADGSGLEGQAEQIWDYVDKACIIDNAKKTGNALDEMEAHRFLEAFDEAHTVLEMRSALRKSGALGQNERPKEVPLTHFLLFKYGVSWNKLVNAPQVSLIFPFFFFFCFFFFLFFSFLFFSFLFFSFLFFSS